MNAFEKTITVNDQDYVFRLPSSTDLIDVDLKALELRKGITDGIGSNGYASSQNLALVLTLCKTDQKDELKKLPAYVVDYLADEVAKWERSFRAQLSGEKTTANS